MLRDLMTDVMHNARNLAVLDQFQKVYLFLLMTSFGKEARTVEKFEFCKQPCTCVAHQN